MILKKRFVSLFPENDDSRQKSNIVIGSNDCPFENSK